MFLRCGTPCDSAPAAYCCVCKSVCVCVWVQVLRVPGGVSEQEEVQVQVTRLLVESYFDVVRKNLQDAVPKAVMHFLVNSVQRGLQQHLIRTLYRSVHVCTTQQQASRFETRPHGTSWEPTSRC